MMYGTEKIALTRQVWGSLTLTSISEPNVSIIIILNSILKHLRALEHRTVFEHNLPRPIAGTGGYEALYAETLFQVQS